MIRSDIAGRDMSVYTWRGCVYMCVCFKYGHLFTGKDVQSILSRLQNRLNTMTFK